MLQKYQNEISPIIYYGISKKKIMKKTLKYLFYSPLTEKVLTECPCRWLSGWVKQSKLLTSLLVIVYIKTKD